MRYDLQTWKRRLAERSDLVSKVTHLTREVEGMSATKVILGMLRERTIRASSPKAAFIHGDQPASCFQDAPLTAICQNVFFEQKYGETNPSARVRYRAMGLMFEKSYVFGKGGRPVIYDRAADARTYLPKDEWWRIVNFDLSDAEKIVDWTHEREWRVCGDFSFELQEATVLVANEASYKSLVKACRAGAEDPLPQLAGIVVMSNLLF